MSIRINKGTDSFGNIGAWVVFDVLEEPLFITNKQWIGVDFDGTLARNDDKGHALPPYPLGQPIPKMVEIVKSLLAAGVTVKIFTARACEPENIPAIQDWTERHGLGRLKVTHQKDYDLIRFFDDRAIPVTK